MRTSSRLNIAVAALGVLLAIAFIVIVISESQVRDLKDTLDQNNYRLSNAQRSLSDKETERQELETQLKQKESDLQDTLKELEKVRSALDAAKSELDSVKADLLDANAGMENRTRNLFQAESDLAGIMLLVLDKKEVHSKELLRVSSGYDKIKKRASMLADAGLLMPPKSTWFEPKLRSGIFIHEI